MSIEDDPIGSRWRAREDARLRLMRLRSVDERSLHRTFVRTAALCANTLGVDRVGIWFIDATKGTLRCDYLLDLRDHIEGPGPELPIGDLGAYEWALLERRAIAAEDVRADAFTKDLLPYFGPLDICATLDAPIYRDGKPIGVLCHEHRVSPRAWKPEEVDFASSMADILALMLVSHELRAAEEHARRTERALLEARRDEALGRIARGVAHDLDNVLSVILLSVGMLARHASEPDVVEAECATIQDAARSAARLTKQLRAYGSRPGATASNVLVDDTVRGVSTTLRSLAGAERTLEIEASAPQAAAAIGPTELEQVLMNLVVNAREATSSGGHIWVSTATDGEHVVLTVRDDGRGMDEFTAAHVFEPFFSTKEGSLGRGLGLSTVQGIVRAAGGEVSVQSVPGEGSAFRVRLPRPVTLAPPAAESRPQRGA